MNLIKISQPILYRLANVMLFGWLENCVKSNQTFLWKAKGFQEATFNDANICRISQQNFDKFKKYKITFIFFFSSFFSSFFRSKRNIIRLIKCFIKVVRGCYSQQKKCSFFLETCFKTRFVTCLMKNIVSNIEICSHIWLVNISNCMYWLDTQSVKLW